MLEIIKTFGSAAGWIMSIIALITLILKPLRTKVIGFVVNHSNATVTSNEIAEIRRIVEEQGQEQREFMTVYKDFAKSQLRNNIKNIYYKHRRDKKLPEYEFKVLVDSYDVYERLHGNTFIEKLYSIMMNWEVLPDTDE